MSAARFFDWFQLAALACLACLALPRAFRLYARGIHVLMIDRERTPGQIAVDLLGLVCLLWWWYELVAYAWPLPVHLFPRWLGIVLFDVSAVKIVGSLLMIVALLFYGLAVRALGDSWRLGIDRNTPGPLITNGIFAWSRNPIYISLDLMIVGTFLIQGRLIFLVISVLFVAMLHLQILKEESFLGQKYGDDYLNYCGCVGRYVTWPSSRYRV